MRHGKSSWDYDLNDKDRPLLERGIADVYLVASKFKTLDLTVDAVFSSPANRALHTAVIFSREQHFLFSNFQIVNELYDFSGESVFQFIRELDNNLGTVIIFGHNNAFTNLANKLGDTYIENVPTAGLVQLKFNTADWSAISDGLTLQTIFPKKLKQ